MSTAEQRAAGAAYMREWRKNNPEVARATDARRKAATRADPERLARRQAYQRQKQKEYRDTYPETRKGVARKSELLRRHGLSVEQYDAMVAERSGLCDSCGRPPAGGRRLSIDHDHGCCPESRSCGQCIRGLLCDSCNGGIGLLRDSIEGLERALAYLRRAQEGTWRSVDA